MDNNALLFLIIWLQASDGELRIGTSNACYGQGPCSRHDLACGGKSSLAIVSAVHGFKRKESLCPSLAINHCNFNTKFCCKEDTVFDCTLPFKDVYIRTLYEQCSGRRNCTYYTDRVQEACSLHTKTLSTFSTIRFSCIGDTDVVRFDRADSTQGKSVYALFDPDGFDHVHDPVLYYSCRVDPATGDVPVNVTINALDVRLDRTALGTCSSLTVRHKRDVVANVTCGQYYKRIFLNSVHKIETVLTPVDLVLTIVEKNMPGYVWLQVESDDVEIQLSCGYLQNGWWDLDGSAASSRTMSSNGSAVVGGVAVVLVLAVILAVVIWWKRRAKVTKYLQTIPISASCSKATVERRLRAQSGCSEVYNLAVQLPDVDPEKRVTLQVRPPGRPDEPIYDRIRLTDNPTTVSAVGIYDHLRHVIVDKDKDKVEGYDQCAVGSVKVHKDASAYDTPESASRDNDDVKRNFSYDHLSGKVSVKDSNFENPDCTDTIGTGNADDDYEPTAY